MRKPLILLPGALTVELLAAGCASPGPGPLTGGPGSGPAGGSSGSQCIPAPRPGYPRAMGDFLVDNTSRTQPLTIRSVQLTRVHGLAQGKPWLTPWLSTGLIGAWYWPPLGTAWDHRKPATGAVLKPRQALNLVLEVWYTNHGDRLRRDAGSAYVTVHYSSGGADYSLAYGWKVIVAAKC
jgi:hypothetical protein